jgi:hypothetical protein
MNAPVAIGKENSADASFKHSVSRSNELLSCAKTAWKIQQQEHQQDPTAPPLYTPNLQLASSSNPPLSLTILEEGLTLLRSMDFLSKQLQKLVRRRGHTNDPTAEISKLVNQLEQDTEELTEFCKQLLAKYGKRRKQERRHWELVVQWFQQVAGRYSSQVQDCLKLRGEVLTEQAQQRRKLVDTSKNKKTPAASSSRATATPLFDSPLFQAPTSTPAKRPPPPKPKPKSTISNGSNQNVNKSSLPRDGYPAAAGNNQQPAYYGAGGAGYGNNKTPNGYYGGAAGYGGASYGGGGAGGAGGIRQRKGTSGPSSSSSSGIDYQQEEEEKVHYQIQQRQQQRQTQQRMDEAQHAETMLGELGQLFGKMSSLIVQQGETLEKIEDDVEAAHADVMAGQEEITKLYHIKKGNRPLIIKTFGILIFLIIFMRGYKN